MSQTLGRGVQVLRSLAYRFGGKPASLKEIAAEVGLPPSSAYRLLRTLVGHGLVEQDAGTRLYALGGEMFALGMAVRPASTLRGAALPVLGELTRQTGEDSHLGVVDGDHGCFIEVVEGTSPLKVVESIGSRMPLHCGATRKVLLANQPQEAIEAYLARPMAAYTERTVIDPQRLGRQLARIRSQGYAISRGDYIRGAVGVAAPVLDHRGKVVAAVSMIGPELRFRGERLRLLIDLTRAAARQVSQRLGAPAMAAGVQTDGH